VGESQNLAAQYPERLAEMTELMSQVRTPSHDFPLIPFDAPVKRKR